MKLRKIPGALVLGLLASLLAHTALYGGQHAMGGAYSDVLLDLALAGGVGLAGLAAALAWAAFQRAADGSILAAHLSMRLPGAGAVFAAAVAWFAVSESAEAAHAGPSGIVVALALAGATWLVMQLGKAVVRAIAGAIVAITRLGFVTRRPWWRPSRRLAPVIPASPLLRRRFARPPPIAIARA